MMSSQHWKSQTKRGKLTPRSKRLKAIDNALDAYEQAKKSGSGTVKAQTDLFNALKTWIEHKGNNWKSSTRNSKIEAGGKGTVETLVDDVLKLNPAFRPQVAGYLSQAITPAPVLLQHGVKNKQKDEDGHWYEIPVQTQENSCGPCSIRMLIKLVNNEDADEAYLRELVEVAEEGGAYGGSLGGGGVVQSGGAHDWSPTGGGTWLVPAALDAVRPQIKCSHGIDTGVLLRTTKQKPAIAVVAWTGGGGGLHYIVVAGKTSDQSKLVILDPFYGVQSVSIAGSTLADYEPKDPNSGNTLATGTWYNWVCKVD